MIQIACVVDNAVYSHLPFWGEQGVAFFVETGNGGVLFDTGWSGTVLLHNMKLLGIEPDVIAALAISHAHYDHTGGLVALLDRLLRVPLYAHPDLFRERFTHRENSITSVGLPVEKEALERKLVLRLSSEPVEILPGVWTTGEIEDRSEPEGRADHDLVRGREGWQPDPYIDDMALVLETGKGLVVLCGCCHAGLLNTLAHVRRTFSGDIAAVAGGTHLISADEAHLAHIIGVLKELDVLRFFPNHCTGQGAYVALAQAFGDKVVPFTVGTTLRLSTA